MPRVAVLVKTLRFHYGGLDQRRAFRFEIAVDPKHPAQRPVDAERVIEARLPRAAGSP